MFNLSKVIYEIDQIVPRDETDIKWRKLFHETIDIRENLTRCAYSLPVEIQEGLATEHLHAKAERIKRVKRDNNGNIVEIFPYEINKDFIEGARIEYEKWERDPKQIRVRLAKNLNESWGQIKEIFKN